MFIYGLSCTCHPERGIRYVGQTKNAIRMRLIDHRVDARIPGPKGRVHSWMAKHGVENIVTDLLDTASCRAEMLQKEVAWIAMMRELGQADMNMTDGGEGVPGVPHTEEWKRAHSAKLKGRKRNPESVALSAAGLKVWHAEQRVAKGLPPLGMKVVIPRKRQVEDEDVPVIRDRIASGESMWDIAEDYGVSYSVVDSIRRGKVYGRINPLGVFDPDIEPIRVERPEHFAVKAKWSDEVVRAVRNAAEAGQSFSSISRETGVPLTTVGRMVRREKYRWVD